MKKLFVSIVAVSALSPMWCLGDRTLELMEVDNNMFMSTVKVQSGSALGTAFILGHTFTNHPGIYYNILVTADHVLTGMPSSNLTLFLRAKDSDGYKKLPFQVPIRENGTNLWTTNPKADVAVMPLPLPQQFRDIFTNWFPSGFLADDNFFTEWKIHPGDEVRILGYPYGFEANEAGFPVLRSGRISSFPLTPAAKIGMFLVDFPVFPGNSGGPVYISERRSMHEGNPESVSIFRILGLIDQETTVQQSLNLLDETATKTYRLSLARVIPSQIIKDTIDMLPLPP